MNRSQFDMVYRGRDQLIQKKDPIFTQPYSGIGRAHFYSPFKLIGNTKIPTFVFNVLFIWMMTITLYFALFHDTIKKIIRFFELPTGDEQNPTIWDKMSGISGVLIHTPRIYMRAQRIRRSRAAPRDS